MNNNNIKKFFFIHIIIILILNISLLSINYNDVKAAIKKDDVNEEIPSEFVGLYQKASQKYGVSWYLLASVHNQETAFSSNVSKSSAGAIGHAQFMRCTWVGWGYSGCKGTLGDSKAVSDEVLKDVNTIKKYKGEGVDGNQDGKADPWDIVDAIYSMASYLSGGIKTKLKQNPSASEKELILAAAYRYNHDNSYGKEVYDRYMRYKSGYKGTSPADSVNLTGEVKEGTWSEGSYSDASGKIQGTPIASDSSESGKLISDGKGNYVYVSPFEEYEIDITDIGNIGVNDKKGYDNGYLNYKLGSFAKFILTVLNIISLTLAILLFGYISLIWLLFVLTMSNIYPLEDLMKKITLNVVEADKKGIWKLSISSAIVVIFVVVAISGLMPTVFIFIYTKLGDIISHMI